MMKNAICIFSDIFYVPSFLVVTIFNGTNLYHFFLSLRIFLLKYKYVIDFVSVILKFKW